MIGDWVVYHGDTEYASPVRIEGMDILMNALITEDREDVGFDGIDPIPLTAEILEKNGWEEKKEQEPFIYYSLKDEKNYISISQEWDGTLEMPYWSLYIGSYLSDATLSIEYVHELQHAFNLIGIRKDFTL